MVKINRYFESEDWKKMAPELKNKAWKEARSGEQAKIVKDMKKDFLDKVKASESLANQERIKKKQRKNVKCLSVLEDVKKHGGPITPDELDKLEALNDKQILSEVKYLRLTVAPNIREKRKVEKKFVKYSKKELIQQITNVLKPKSDDVSNVDVLLYKYLSDVVLTRETIQLYQPTRYGFQPEDLTVESFKWELSKKIEDFDFITRRTGTYLRCSV